MARIPAKYYLALVPEGKIQMEATGLKEEMKKLFNLKYALKSPAHITVKMPFEWNENKEQALIQKLSDFLEKFHSFDLKFDGFDHFGNRVIFVDVQPSPVLDAFQKALNEYCKMELMLNRELSDKAFHPHMTIAFKDLKPKNFELYWNHIQTKIFEADYTVKDVALLKRLEGRWHVLYRFTLKS